MNRFTIASLFDGSGGFPLAAKIFGGRPVWASEIEPFAIAVTRQQFPEMVHFGSVTEIDGGKVPAVDVVSFGSPCQDLSVAGKKQGLSGNRSGLFFEAIRIIKQIRSVNNGKPRFVIWENVKGALSSNNGDDFGTVLESFTGLFGEPLRFHKCGKWNNAGHVYGGSWSISWRVVDAQFWGVPCRRPRLFVVVDCGGNSSGKVLFDERHEKIYFGSFEKIFPWARTGLDSFDSNGIVTSSRANRYSSWSNVAYTLCASDYRVPAVICNNAAKSTRLLTPTEYARLQGFPDNWAKVEPIDATPDNVKFWRGVWDVWRGIEGKRPITSAALFKWLNKPHSDNAEYKLWGNGVALPCVGFIMSGISEEMKKT